MLIIYAGNLIFFRDIENSPNYTFKEIIFVILNVIKGKQISIYGRSDNVRD